MGPGEGLNCHVFLSISTDILRFITWHKVSCCHVLVVREMKNCLRDGEKVTCKLCNQVGRSMDNYCVHISNFFPICL